jgi:hypothetical protein
MSEKQFALGQDFDRQNTRTSTHQVSQPTSGPPNRFRTSQTGPMQSFSPTFLGKRVTVADVCGGCCLRKKLRAGASSCHTKYTYFNTPGVPTHLWTAEPLSHIPDGTNAVVFPHFSWQNGHCCRCVRGLMSQKNSSLWDIMLPYKIHVLQHTRCPNPPLYRRTAFAHPRRDQCSRFPPLFLAKGSLGRMSEGVDV